MMKQPFQPFVFLFLIACFSLGFSSSARGQILGNISDSPFASISQNSISNIQAIGDTLWIGPQMQRNINYSVDQSFYRPQFTDSISDGPGRVFSISLSPDTVVAGLGRTGRVRGEDVATGYGFYISTNGGGSAVNPTEADFQFLNFPLDDPGDSLFTYGAETYYKLPVTVPEQSPPYDIDHDGETIFAAAWASGVLRSQDFGKTWENLLLPPSFVDTLRPGRSYNYRFDPRQDNNLLGFSVHIDNDGWVWHGSANGVNISPNALTAPKDSITWYHRTSDNGADFNRMLGDWVTHISESDDGRIWLVNWVAQAGEQFGIVSTSDKGRTFKQYLAGEKIYQISVEGDRILATGDNGLFISEDNGRSWTQRRVIRSNNTFIKSTATYYGTTQSGGRVWVSTSDGMATTTDPDLQDWEIVRVNLSGENGNQFQASEDMPNVETYAYPNPFSPSRHEYIRIRVEAQNNGAADAKITLYDFGMNVIRTLEPTSVNSDQAFEAVWDGKDQGGKYVANGAVFYKVEIDGEQFSNKIMVLD